jgi:GNAT superfamily N-acetyltransferase
VRCREGVVLGKKLDKLINWGHGNLTISYVLHRVENTTLADLPLVFELFEHSIIYQERKGYPVWKNYDKEAIRKDIEDKNQYKVFVDSMVGIVFSVGYADKIIWRELDKGDAIYLHRIVVNPTCKGKKLFGLILEWAIAHAKQKGLRSIRMDTWAANPTIITYYKNFGFTVVENYTTPDTEALPVHNRNLSLTLLEYKPEGVLLDDFNRILQHWITELGLYPMDQLRMKPSVTSWSLGQVYMHLVDDTNWYIEQIRICVLSNDHADGEKSPFAENLFRKNDFPDESLAGSPDNLLMPQPESKAELLKNLLTLKTNMNEAVGLISTSPFHGKTKHPGFNYFSAKEWLQFAEMHFRHHLRQKRRIDDFLLSSRPSIYQ